MKRNLACKLVLTAILFFTIPMHGDSPKDLENLLAATYAPATALAKTLATTIENYSNAASQGTWRYGDRVRLRHNATGYHLFGLNKPFTPKDTLKTSMAVGAKDSGSWWIIKGPHVDGQRLTGNMWMPVTQGSTLRLEQEGTGLNLHSKTGVFAPLNPKSKDKRPLQEVSLFGNGGIGDTNDNWLLQIIAGTPEAKIGIAIKLENMSTSGMLESAPLRYPDGLQVVYAAATADDNGWWIIEDIIPGAAPDLNILCAIYGDLNSSIGSKNMVVTSKLDAMTYNGTLMFPIQPIPNQPMTAMFNTFSISDPTPDKIKNLATCYSANQSIYFHLALSEYDIVALPDYRDPKIFTPPPATSTVNINQNLPDLKILYAVYGDLNYTTIGNNGGVGDPTNALQVVTDKVQALIKNGQIIFDSTPKSQIINPPVKAPKKVPQKASKSMGSTTANTAASTSTPTPTSTSPATASTATTAQTTQAQIATLRQQLANEKNPTTIAQLTQQISTLQIQPNTTPPAEPESATTATTTASTSSLTSNTALLIIYQASANVYMRIIGEDEVTLLSATDQSQSTLIYAPQILVNAPAQFSMEVGSAGRITVGSLGGVLSVYALSMSGDSISSYNTFNVTGNPWTQIPMPTTQYPSLQSFRDISFSSDGLLFLLDSNGKVYRYDTTKQSLLALPAGSNNTSLALNYIAAGNARSIWGVDSKAQILYSYNINQWVKVSNRPSVYVAAGVDGTVVNISPTGDASMLSGTTWYSMPGSKLDRVAVCNSSNIWGIRNGNLLIFSAGQWRSVQGNDGNVATGFKEVAINAAGTLFATTTDGRLYMMGEAGFQITQMLTNKAGTKLQVTGSPLISPNMTRARAIQSHQLVVNTNATTKQGKLAKLQAAKS